MCGDEYIYCMSASNMGWAIMVAFVIFMVGVMFGSV